MPTDIVENYIKTIYHLSHDDDARITTTAIADAMKVKASSVTDMLQRLEDMELADYFKYQGVKLTDKGRKTAVEIIRRHRLWEVFLVEKLHFSWSEVHKVAEQMEHIHSEKLIDRLEEFLGYPKWDPHGDPIPDKEGNISTRDQVLLKELKVKQVGIILGVTVDDEAFLQFLEKHQLTIGKKIMMRSLFDFDDSVEIEMDKKHINLSGKVANSLLVRRIGK